MKIVKKMDIVIIIGLLLLSFAPDLIFAKSLSKQTNSSYASIKVEGKHYDDINLSNYNGDKEIKLNLEYGENVLLIENGSISMKSANCNDALCVKQGNISKVGQTIICLPHELIIEIKGDESDSNDDFIMSH